MPPDIFQSIHFLTIILYETILAMTLFSRLSGPANLCENKVLANFLKSFGTATILFQPRPLWNPPESAKNAVRLISGGVEIPLLPKTLANIAEIDLFMGILFIAPIFRNSPGFGSPYITIE